MYKNEIDKVCFHGDFNPLSVSDVILRSHETSIFCP